MDCEYIYTNEMIMVMVGSGEKGGKETGNGDKAGFKYIVMFLPLIRKKSKYEHMLTVLNSVLGRIFNFLKIKIIIILDSYLVVIIMTSNRFMKSKKNNSNEPRIYVINL